MGKVIKKYYSVNNMEVELHYRRILSDNSFIIVGFSVYHGELDITRFIEPKRLRSIVRQLTAALDKKRLSLVGRSAA